MKLISVSFVWLLLALYFCNRIEGSNTNFVIKSLGICNDTQRQVKFYYHVNTENGKQYLSYNFSLPFPLGDNIRFACLIQLKTGNQFLDLFTIREKNLCKAFNKYMGEFWYDLQRHSGVLPGVCPVQQGIYHGNHIQLQFEKVALQTFPFGTLRFIAQGIDNSNKICVWCIWFIVENIIN